MSGMDKKGDDKPLRPIQEEKEGKLKRQDATIFSKQKLKRDNTMFKNMLDPKKGTPTYEDANKNKGTPRPRNPSI